MIEPRCPIDDVPAALAAAQEAGLWSADRRSAVFHDLDRLEGRIADLRAAFPDNALHAIAVKANPLVELLKVIVKTGAGLEAASWEEVECALAAGCPPERLVFDSPVKTAGELRAALELGLWINTDNAEELQYLEGLGAPGAARIGVRVNPQIGEGAIAFTSTVGRRSKFGVPLQDVPELVRRFPFVTGLHVHTGSQGVGLDLLGAAALATAEVVSELGLSWLDVGGGVPVRYTKTDPEPPSFAEWGQALGAMKGWGEQRILTEVGRSIHAGTGWALSRIETVKEVDGQPNLVVHLGADFLLRRVYRADEWDHEFVVLDPEGRPRGGPLTSSRIAGPLCFAGDLLARNRPLPAARPGDLLLIRDCGAYTLSMWSRHCSRSLPPTIGYRSGSVELLHRGERPEDVVRFWSL